MISFTKSVFVFDDGSWTEVAWANISFAEESRAVIEIQTDSEVQQGISLRIGNASYEVVLDLTAEEEANLPFKRKKYTTIKCFNETSKVIIAVSSSEESGQVEELLGKLIYFTKFLRGSIMRQVELNLADMLLDSFVSALRRKFPSKDRHSKAHPFRLHDFFESIGIEFGRELPARDLRNIVYKSVLYYGMFPIEVRLKYSDYSYFNQRLHMFFYDDQTPWSNRLASEIKIGRNVFRSQQAASNQHKQLVRMRILDFFPLDSWIETIACFLTARLDRFLLEIREVAMPHIQRHPSDSSQQSLSEPLLQTKSDQTEQVKDNLYKLFAKHGANELYAQIAKEFYTYYNMQLSESKAFRQISKAIATSMRSSVLVHNCNQMASSIVSIVQDGIKKIAEPLTLLPKLRSEFQAQIRRLEEAQSPKDFKRVMDALDSEKFLLYTKYATEKDLLSYVPPVIAQELLDYFGFYTDHIAKEFFFETLKNVSNHTFRSMWNQFKEIDQDPTVSMYSQRFDSAEAYLQSTEHIKPTIEKRDLKPICFLIVMYQNEKEEREKDLCKNLLFWYYNSIRLRNSYKYNKLVSCVGNVIVKDTI